MIAPNTPIKIVMIEPAVFAHDSTASPDASGWNRTRTQTHESRPKHLSKGARPRRRRKRVVHTGQSSSKKNDLYFLLRLTNGAKSPCLRVVLQDSFPIPSLSFDPAVGRVGQFRPSLKI